LFELAGNHNHYNVVLRIMRVKNRVDGR
jgi:hypothetical protein